MSEHIAQKISEKAGMPDMVRLLSAMLNSSELSSLLLEVHRQRSLRITPAALLQQYRNNRFVQPAETDMVSLLEKELQVLKLLQAQHYLPLELSPVAQFGSCSVVGTVNQNKIISAGRNTEVLADATNALALHIADIRQRNHTDVISRYCTVQRHLRAVHLPQKGYSPHFKIACMVAAGRDTGNYAFELLCLREQLLNIHILLTEVFNVQDLYVRMQPRAGYTMGDHFIKAQQQYLADLPFEIQWNDAVAENNYYKGLQFKVYIRLQGSVAEIADGGFVDWTQQLMGNGKERCLISGIGLSLLHTLQERQNAI